MHSDWKGINWQAIAQRLVECSACSGTGENTRIPIHQRQAQIEHCSWCGGHGFFDSENRPQRGEHEAISE